MKHYALAICLLFAFAVAVGDFAFRTWYPSTTPEYTVGGVVRPLFSADGSEAKRHLYLRRSWYVTEPPSRAWLQVLGNDELEIFVNGQNVGRSSLVGIGRTAAVLGDITTYLHHGHNVIAIHALQSYIDRPPAVSIDGQLEFPDGKQTSLADPNNWRVGDVYDHNGLFWYETEFHDAHWSKPRVGDPVNWLAQVNVPPRSVTEPRHSQWINPAKSEQGMAAMASSLSLPDPPREGWLRVIATGPYRIAINGNLVVDDQLDLADVPPESPLERTFDVSAFLKSGANTVSISVTTPGESPRLRADLEATTIAGQREYIATDDSWKSAAGAPIDWQQPNLANAAWQACKPETGFVGVSPYLMKRELADVVPPIGFWFSRAVIDGLFILASGLIAGCGSYVVGKVLQARSAGITALSALPFLALVPSSLVATFADYATWDLGWTGRDVYQPTWVFALWGLVAVQWLVLCIFAAFRAGSLVQQPGAPLSAAHHRMSFGLVLCWAMLFGVALWLRLRDITAEPIHHDEVTCFAFTEGVRQYGFPGGQVDPDVPFGWCATSELTYYPTALCSLFTDNPLLILRIPATIFSMATMVLLAYIGWRWFNSRVAFVAAALFAVSPHVVGMADFGRYLSQVQFFTLLTMYLTYEAVRGKGTPPLGLLWGSAVSFIAMYLSWEGTGFFGIGLAIAVLFHRRRDLRPILTCPSFYYASALVGMVVLGQYSHRVMQQTERIWYGEGINSLTIKPMWTYPNFDAFFFLTNSSWIRDAFFPMLGLYAACLLTINHRWRFPLRFSIICLVMNAEMMSFLLPLRTNRYSYHLSEILILISAAALVAGAEVLLRLTQSFPRLSPYRWYAAAVAGSAILAGTVMGSGWAVRTSELDNYTTNAYDIRQLHNPNWNGITQYLLAHMGKNDALIAIYPHAENFEIAAQQGPNAEPRKVDYWLESKLIVQATLGDTHQIPLDRRSGAKMLYNVEQIEKLFAEHDRIWYCTMRFGHSRINEGIVSQYLREHMDVVYEDFATSLMVRDRNSRPANVRLSEEDAGELASDYYLR
jgi:hypothetical protein